MSRSSFRQARFSLVPIADSRYERRSSFPDPMQSGFPSTAPNEEAEMATVSTTTAGEIIYGGYWPGVIGEITGLHGVYYREHWGFDISFEAQVGRELSEFLRDFRDGRDFFRTARAGNRFAGSIALDGKDADGKGARLRWYIVAPEFQKLGIGRRLITDAVEFCRTAGYRRIYLWTFKGLDRARVLYESNGFRLDEEHDVRQWGNNITEQKFSLEWER